MPRPLFRLDAQTTVNLDHVSAVTLEHDSSGTPYLLVHTPGDGFPLQVHRGPGDEPVPELHVRLLAAWGGE